MKLFYSPGACSLSPHIVSRELGLPIELKKVNTKDKTMEGGGDYWKVNGRGYVPALELDNGQILTEGPAIVQYLADQKPEAGLAPKAGTWERYRLQEWLNFLTSEIHKQFSPLFKPNTPEDYKKICKENLATRFDWLDRDRKSTRLNSSHLVISYAVFCLKKKKITHKTTYNEQRLYLRGM